MKKTPLRLLVYRVLEGGKPYRVSKTFEVVLISLILINVVSVILESVTWLKNDYSIVFAWIERVSVCFFTLEYILRVWTCVENAKYRGRFGRFKYMVSFMAMIDLLAVLPSYMIFINFDLRIIRMLRMFRLLRVFKLGAYVGAIRLMTETLQKKKEQLLISLMFMLVMLFIVSSLMYYLEHDAQPEAFGSIPESVWWGVATLTTVGYGDVYPITGLGRFFGGLIALLGIGMFALPAGILASGLSEAFEQHDKIKEKKKILAKQGKAIPDMKESVELLAELEELSKEDYKYCPHCGKELPHPNGHG